MPANETRSDASDETRLARWAWVAVFALAAALLIAPGLGHFDDADAQLYQVVIRKMAQGRKWLDPSYLDHFGAHFREHLPFGFWPFALAQLVGGEAAPRVLAALISLGVLALIAFAGTRIFGEWPALAAVLVLATTETFFRYAAATRLDGLLMLLANAAALPALFGLQAKKAWAGASLFAALAVLVKGPFGLVPITAAAMARAAIDRSRRALLRAAIAVSFACVPATAFLLVDRFLLQQGFWEKYGHDQLFASAIGLRTDGSTQWWFPLATVAGRFWPGMLLLAALVVSFATRPRAVKS